MVECMWVWRQVPRPFTVPWARAQCRDRVHLRFPQISRSFVILLGVYSFYAHQIPETPLNFPSLTHRPSCGGESRAVTCRRWWGEGDRFYKFLKFIMFHPEPTIHTLPPAFLRVPVPNIHLVIQMRNLGSHEHLPSSHPYIQPVPTSCDPIS